MLKIKSGHIRLNKAGYKDLHDVFPRLFNTFLEVTGQDSEESKEVNDMLLAVNLRYLKDGEKPEGFNRQNAVRLMFPISDNVEMYVYSDIRGMEAIRATDAISQILTEVDIAHEITWDETVIEELRRKKALALSNR